MPPSSSSSSSSSSTAHWTTATLVVVVVVASTVAASALTGSALLLLLRRRRRSGGGGGGDADGGDAVGPSSSSVTITLPEWATESPDPTMNGAYAKKYRSDDEMMSLAVSLSDANVEAGTGGPFGAAIFERVRGDDDGDGGGGEYCKLVSVGMNRVVPLRNSTLHGEMVAIQIAQSKLDTFTLSEIDGVKRQFELFTSCEPCAMCLGGTLWSGVSRLVCGATKDDAQSIGFDEGPVTEDSYAHLVKAGVSVSRGVMREEAADVLRRYGCRGVIYNRTSFVGGGGGSADVVDTVAAS